MIEIKFAKTDGQILRCFPVMQELRTHIATGEEFLERVKRQQENSLYNLVYLEENNEIKSCTGFVFGEKLFSSKMMYVDDLVTAASERSKGYGEMLFDWLLDYAKMNNCDQLHLDSGVQRYGAHRFYLKKRMDITSHHFVLNITEKK
ncbi:MAG: GNAT family N-acetyltransferase [Ignavibacteriaceae bacterium]